VVLLLDAYVIAAARPTFKPQKLFTTVSKEEFDALKGRDFKPLSDEELAEEAKRTFHSRFSNYFGQAGVILVVYAGLFVLFVYLMKFVIIRRSPDVPSAAGWYAVLFLACAPFVSLLVSSDWRNEFAYVTAVWIGAPMQVLLVPTISFVLDIKLRHTPLKDPRLRHILEIVLGVPLWYGFAPLVGLFCCGMYWI
jgi:hypothetical protein